MQSILILSTVRSGSSRLLEAISKAYNQEGVFEPTSSGSIKVRDYNPEVDIVKIVVNYSDSKELIERAKEFDKVILLDRKDVHAQALSYLNLWKRKDSFRGHDDKYIPEEFNEEQINEAKDLFLNDWKVRLNEVSQALNIAIVYLEDLIAHRDIGVDYDKELFTEKYRLRQEKNTLF